MASASMAAGKPVPIGEAEFQDRTYPVYSEGNGAERFKYLLLENGRKLDLREVRAAALDEEKAGYGTFSRSLLERLRRVGEDESLDVYIEFNLKQPSAKSKGDKLDRDEALVQRSEAYARGLARLEDLFGRKTGSSPAFKGRHAVRKRLTKGQINRLKHDPEMASVYLPLGKLPEPGRSASLGGSTYGPGSGGIEMAGLCSGGLPGVQGYCGQGVTVGLVEPDPLPAGAATSYLNGAWFSQRTGTALLSPHVHGLWTTSIIRNTFGTDTTIYEKGGSRKLGTLKYAYFLNTDDRGFDAYDWVLGQGAKITSNSYFFYRERGGDDSLTQTGLEREYDIQAATPPYALNVIAAGNTGDGDTPGPSFIACLDGSNLYNPGGPWSTEECQRITWWNHNSIIVGSMDNAANLAAYSSFRNGPSGDEAPHVVARGSFVELPWMKPYGSPSTDCYEMARQSASDLESKGQICGTSFSTPAVASLSANLLSKYADLSGYPEAVRALMMAASSPLPSTPRWRTSGAEDLKSGAGIPSSSTLVQLAGNKKTGFTFTTSSPFGYTRNKFAGGTLTGTHTYNITVTSSTAQNLQWWASWMGDPSNHPADVNYPADDIDITVSRSGSTKWSDLTAPSTEHVSIYKPAGTVVFTVTINLYQKNSNPGSDIYYALAWAGTGSLP